MSSINKAMILGHLGRDPEIRHTQSGKKIAHLSIATSEKWKNAEGWQERTEWHRVVIFNEKLAEVAEDHLKKGSCVYIEGTIQTRKWQKDGQDRYSTEIVLQPYRSELRIITTPKEAHAANVGAAHEAERNREELDSEIPF